MFSLCIQKVLQLTYFDYILKLNKNSICKFQLYLQFIASIIWTEIILLSEGRRSRIRASWYNYEDNQQDALYRLIYYSKSALHVSGYVFAQHQEHVTVFTVSGSVHPGCCRLVSLNGDTSRQQLGWTLPDTVNTVKCFWWWAKTSPETCRDDLE